MEQKKVTEEMRAQIIAERKAGKKLVDIASEHELSRSYVNRICLDAGLKSREWTKRTHIQNEREYLTEELVRFLLHGTTDPVILKVGHLIEEMIEADGGTFYSEGNVGLSFSPTEIEIVDTRTGAIASLQLHFKKV